MAWKQFGRPSGIFIDKNDMLYVSDSESEDAPGKDTNNPGCKRGIRGGSIKEWMGDPTPERGGRPKRIVRVTAKGRRSPLAANLALMRSVVGLAGRDVVIRKC
jgi:hypothetical protein